MSERKRVEEAYVQLPLQDCHVSDLMLNGGLGLWGIVLYRSGFDSRKSHLVKYQQFLGDPSEFGLALKDFFRQVLAKLV